MINTRRGTVVDLKEYIKNNLKKGYTIESLKWALVNQGYTRLEVDKAIKKTQEELASSAPLLRAKPQITHEVVGIDELSPQAVEKKSFLGWLFGS